MAVALANAIEILKEMVRRGHDVDWVATRLAFFWAPANDFFEEVARIRAVRRLWYRIMKYRFEAKNPRSMWMRCHVQTSGVSLTREEPMNNVVRAAYHALAAILGGVQSLHVDSYDEAYSVPSEEASIISLRTQQIIEAETQVTQVVDPLGGSFYVEALTNDLEKRILDEVDEIERRGGIVETVTSGWLHKKVASHIEREQKMIANGEIKVVGRNYFRDPNLKMPKVWVHQYDDSIREEMREKLARIKQQRDNEKASSTLSALKEACKRGDNVMDYTLECARADVTEGEMRRAFTEAFGTWKPPLFA
jgi:methylmalonyl-CoA mutase N-terminal domain/subunit